MSPAAKQEITYSRLSSWLTCPQKEYFSYRAGKGFGVKPSAPFIPFVEGDLGHYALYHWYKRGKATKEAPLGVPGQMLRDNLLKRIDEMLEEFRPMDVDIANQIDVKLAALIGACMGYKQTYAATRDAMDVLLLEAPFEFEFEGVVIRGKIDRFIRDRESGKTVLWENKFVSTVSANKYVQLPLDLQGMLYCEGVKQLTGEYPDLKAWDFIIKSQLRRKGKAEKGDLETIPTFTARVTQQYLEEPDKKFFRPPPILVKKTMLVELKKQLKVILKHFSDEPYMAFSSCEGMYGRVCVFSEACAEKLMGHRDGWDGPACTGTYKVKEALHEELAR